VHAESPTLTDRDAALAAALAEGELPELPPNHPRGLLGEKNPDLRKVDTFEPDLTAGISQENDLPVVWLGVVLAYLLFFPLAFWLLWKTPLFTTRAKVIATVVGSAGIFAVIALLILR
jgi:hypothetical protein